MITSQLLSPAQHRQHRQLVHCKALHSS